MGTKLIVYSLAYFNKKISIENLLNSSNHVITNWTTADLMDGKK